MPLPIVIWYKKSAEFSVKTNFLRFFYTQNDVVLCAGKETRGAEFCLTRRRGDAKEEKKTENPALADDASPGTSRLRVRFGFCQVGDAGSNPAGAAFLKFQHF